ncbi:MAG: ATP-dependent DNA helicase Rep, partial [Gammaproteobacteria bacterium]|nr:ATP-dependent DNA helicase Rep [Gammaproteobacteria bacterium]
MIRSVFHSLGLNILCLEDKLLGYKPGFSIFGVHDAEEILRELPPMSGNSVDDSGIIMRRIFARTNELLDPKQALAKAEEDLDTQAA